MTESQYIDLRQLTKTLINLSISQGKELKPQDIDTFIDQAVTLSRLEHLEKALEAMVNSPFEAMVTLFR